MTLEPSGSLHHLPDGASLAFQRALPFDLERVWDAVATSPGLSAWIGEFTGDPASGTVEFAMTAESPDAQPHPVEIVRCSPGHAWEVISAPQLGGIHLAVELHAADGGTALTFSQLKIGADQVESMGPGWEYYLDRLALSLSGGDTSTIGWDPYPAQLGPYYAGLTV